MSGATEPDYSAQLWYGPPRRSQTADGESRLPEHPAGTTEVSVRLFGILADWCRRTQSRSHWQRR